MAASVVQVRMDEELRDDAARLFDDLGLDLPTAIRMFLKKSLSINGIPFEVRNETPNEETKRAIENARNGIGLSRAFSSVAELMEDLNADDQI